VRAGGPVRFLRQPPVQLQVAHGSDVVLECAATGGKASPSVTWKREDGTALPSGRQRVMTGMSRVKLLLTSKLCDLPVCEPSAGSGAVSK